MSAGITNGWDSPPAFALSPDGSKICIACWGPEGLPGGVLPTLENFRYFDDDARIQWFQPGDAEDVQPWKELTWDDGRIYGLNESHGQAWSVDDETLELQYFTKVHNAVAYSPDGKWIAHNPAGLAIYDGESGMATTKIPMIVGGTEMVWSPVAEQRRVALVVGPGNQFKSEPGVHIFDDGELVATVHDEPTQDKPDWKFPDVSQFVFSEDGNRCALITAEDTVAIWTVEDGGSHLKNLTIAPGASGLLWSDRGLVAVGEDQIQFLDVDSGGSRGFHDLVPPAGLLEPVPESFSWLNEIPGDRSYFPIADPGAGWRWVLARAEGLVVCEPHHQERLDESLVLSLAGGRLGWPWRWAANTAATTVVTDPDEIDHSKIKSLWKAYLERGDVPDQDEAFMTMVLDEYKDDFVMKRVVAETKLETAKAPTMPVGEYYAPEPLTGEEVTAKKLCCLQQAPPRVDLRGGCSSRSPMISGVQMDWADSESRRAVRRSTLPILRDVSSQAHGAPAKVARPARSTCFHPPRVFARLAHSSWPPARTSNSFIRSFEPTPVGSSIIGPPLAFGKALSGPWEP